MRSEDKVKRGKKAITEYEKKQWEIRWEPEVSSRKEWSVLRNSSGRTRQLRTKKPPLDFTTRGCGRPPQEQFQWLLRASSHSLDCVWTAGNGDSADFSLKKFG